VRSPKISRNPITLERPSAAEQPLQPELNTALVRELLFRTKGAGIALLAATLLMWLIISPESGAQVAAFAALVGFTVLRTAGAVWIERAPERRFRTGPVFAWFAAMCLLIGASVGAIVMTSYQDLPPLGVAMCSVCIVGINSAALVSLAGSPLAYVLYVAANMAALGFVSFAHPLHGLERPFQAMQVIYSAALFAMMRSVHRSLRDSILLQLQLGDSLSELGATQAELMEASRKTGRADVATAVIHNVGNVLNSVNVSAELVAGIVGRSRIGNLSKLGAMIAEHRDDLAAFFRDDPRGKKLPEYFAELAGTVERDHQEMKTELSSLGRNIERIRVIVQSQQAHVGQRAGVETVELREMLDDALELHAAYFAKHAIAAVRAFDPLPPVRLDRYNVQQIVMNLLANARDAVMSESESRGVGTPTALPAGRGASPVGSMSQGEPRQITVRTRRGASGGLEISVEDTGCGIEPANLDRIFSLGFTTKQDGHGLGLHYSVCVARELEGTLTARSDGPGKGATFVLALPLVPADPPAASASERVKSRLGLPAVVADTR
jgi:signal transduction histidine kinase